MALALALVQVQVMGMVVGVGVPMAGVMAMDLVLADVGVVGGDIIRAFKKTPFNMCVCISLQYVAAKGQLAS